MNEPACRAYRAAILPTFLHSRPNPKFNPKTKANTNAIGAGATYTELQVSSVTQIVCARHFVQKLGQVQHTNYESTTNRISGVWALMSTAVRYRRPSNVSNGIHTSHRHTDSAHVCQAAYTISKDVRHSLKSLLGPRDGRVGSAPPPPTPPARLSRSG